MSKAVSCPSGVERLLLPSRPWVSLVVGLLKYLRTVCHTFWKLQAGFRGLNRQIQRLALVLPLQEEQFSEDKAVRDGHCALERPQSWTKA